jgi:hypothetical protein
VAEFNAKDRTLKIRIVYYGPAVGGKTTNLRVLHRFADASKRGEMISLNSLQDRTILFDMMPLNPGRRGGVEVKLQLIAVPGQAIYGATRKVALKGVDGVVFVANSASDRFYDNSASLEEMRRYLIDSGVDPDRTPIVFQYNKRDLPEVSQVEALDRALNVTGEPSLPAVAVRGEGVLETLQTVLERTIAALTLRYPRNDLTRAASAQDWARGVVDSLFGRGSLTADDQPTGPVQERAIRIAAGEAGQTDPISITEAYADACARLGAELSGVQAQVARAEGRIDDLRRATRLAGALVPRDVDGAARALLSSLGEASAAAHASLGLIQEAGVKALCLPPLERDPVLADAGGQAWATLQQGLAGAAYRPAHGDATLETCLAWAGPVVTGVTVVPVRSGERMLGLALLYLLEDDPVPDAAALAHLDDLAAVFASALERAVGDAPRPRTGPISAVRPEMMPASLRLAPRSGRPVFDETKVHASRVAS